MKIKAIVFDLDGTITDTVPLTIYSIKETAYKYTGKYFSDEEILKEFGPIDTDIIKKFVENEKKDLSVEDYVEHFSSNFERLVKPIDGILELLKFIKSKDIKLGLFTGRSLRVTEIILDKLKLSNYFDEIMAGDFTKNPKPDPEGINKILKIFDVESKESIYVGDFAVDIAASRAAGVIPVLALWSSTGSKELIDLNPDKYFTSPYDFIEWLMSL